ncbi:Transcription factor [Sesamum alatum]|uniref:Transcription factor n=1 Tax=Sesamum alatum TaxID=300844 RepID=A0AAE2CX02_9LAMI|nr:Transcription factor [Sesamum alatum]
MRNESGTSSSGSKKLDRKTVEKNRRIQMKDLCLKLVSLIPPQHFRPAKDYLTQHDQLEQAASYIQQLSTRVEELRKRKVQALAAAAANDSTKKGPPSTSRLVPPCLKFRVFRQSLEVVLISGLRRNFNLHQVVSILEDEGAEVVTVNLSTIGDKVFHTLHAQVDPTSIDKILVKFCRVGVDTSRICGRLQELIS